MHIIERINRVLGASGRVDESKIEDAAAAILRRVKAPDPRDALAHAAVDVMEDHAFHTGEMLPPHVAAHIALGEMSGHVRDGTPDPRDAARTLIKTPGTAENAAMQARLNRGSSLHRYISDHARVEPDVRAAFHAAVRKHVDAIPHFVDKIPAQADLLNDARDHAHDPKHLPMVAAAFAHESHATASGPLASAIVRPDGKIRHASVGEVPNGDHADRAARVFEGIASARALAKRGIGLTPDRAAAATDVLAHDPVMSAPKALAAWYRHRNTIDSWAEDLPLRHQPHEMHQRPVAENDTHRVYRIDDAHTAGLKCWRPDGQNARYCLTAPGSGEQHLRHYGGSYPFFIATRKGEAGEHLAAAYIPSMLHNHPTQAVRNEGNDGPLVGDMFEALHPLLAEAHPAIDEVAHQYRHGGDIARRHR